MMMLSPRQVHLDFHTSEKIPDIGKEFDPVTFAKTFQEAHVSSVTVFARCHHGWLYYPSKAFPQAVHPTLTDPHLLEKQVDALHAAGIKAPVYITVQWDYYSATRHPEWLIRKRDGSHEGKPFSEPGFYQSLCVNTGYYDYLLTITDEVMELLGDRLDGLFFDIVGNRSCVCAACRREMEEKGLDFGDETVIADFAKLTMDRFKDRMTTHVHERSPNCAVFYNAGHIGPKTRDSAHAYTHFELESLPSGGWGYLHFPVTARYARTLGNDCMGMTGKFHTAWGDFHSLKNQAALEFECFKMLSYGFAASIGDQLEPSGKLNPATYSLIGKVFSAFQAREEWARPSRALVDTALITPEAGLATAKDIPASIFGAAQLLEELAIQFDIIDPLHVFDPYKLLILPEGLSLTPEVVQKMQTYLQNGGKVISVGGGGLQEDTADLFGVRGNPHVGKCDFAIANNIVGKALPQGNEFVMQLSSVDLNPHSGTRVLMEASAPYFYRQGTSFCSHRYTPSSKSGLRPCVVQRDGVIVFAHSLFLEYRKYAPLWCKEMMRDAISILLKQPLVTHNGPSTLQVSILDQPQHSRYTLHLLSYVPIRKCTDFDLVEEATPVLDLELQLHLPRPIRHARLVPEDIPVEIQNGALHLDKICGYSIVELNY